jgi:hypothetical protein
MAKILRQRRRTDGIVAEVLLTAEETKELGGEMDDITLFAQIRKQPARISLRGKNEATKYFLIPRTLRRTLNTMGSVSVQRIRRDSKDIFVYIVDNDAQRQSFIANSNE